MATRIYVGNLPFTVTIQELTQHFSQVGKVNSADIARDAYDGRSRGFAFVEMAAESDAEKAISQFDGTDYKGRTIKVNVARPRGGSKYASGRYDRGGNFGDAPPTGYGAIYGKDLTRGGF